MAELDGLDFVVMNKPDATTADNKQLFDSLARHWQRCRRDEQGGKEQE